MKCFYLLLKSAQRSVHRRPLSHGKGKNISFISTTTLLWLYFIPVYLKLNNGSISKMNRPKHLLVYFY